MGPLPARRLTPVILALVLTAVIGVEVSAATPTPESGGISDEFTFRTAWSSIGTTQIDLDADIILTCAGGTTPLRNSTTPIVVEGHGFTLANECTSGDHGVLRSTGSGALTVRNITITGGHAIDSNGSGILTTESGLTIENSVITGNTGGPNGSAGGGVASDGGPLVITDSTFTGNSATGFGSAMASSTSISLTRTTVTGNTGVAFNSSEKPSAIATGGPIEIIDSTVSNNTTDGDAGIGGGSTVEIRNSTVSGNQANGISASGDVTVVNSTVSGNGGAGLASDGTIALAYATVVANEGLNLDAPMITAFGSVVARPRNGSNCANPATSEGFNFADDNSCGLPGSEVHVGVGPGLGALRDNGGPTATKEPIAGSPLVDAIPNGNCQDGGGAGIVLDQRGQDRPDPAGGPCDIGAVERTGRARPDGRIRRGTGPLVGNDVFNTSGAGQTRHGAARVGQTVTYYASIQNDAPFAERVRLRGQGTTNRAVVVYRRPDGNAITPGVTSGTFRTPLLAPGASYLVRIVVQVRNTAPRGFQQARTLTALSTTQPALRDTVRFITHRS